MKTAFDAFMASADAAPGNACLAAPAMAGRAYHPGGVEYTYAEVRDRIEALRQTYAAAGYGHGHRVALLLENRPEHFLHLLALNALGASAVPINPDYRHDEVLYQMDHSEADLAVVIESRVDDLEAVARARDKPLPVVPFEDIPAVLPAAPAPPPRSGAPGLDTEASLLYTSGTTGRPKGCILTNDYFLISGRWYSELGGLLAMRPDRERLFNPLPLFHMNCGVISFMCMVFVRGCLIVPDRFHPKSWWREVTETRATVIHYLGVVPPLLLNLPETPEERAHEVRVGVGAGIEPDLHEVFERRFGFPLVEVWGMTETGRIFADCHEPRRIHTRAFGRPVGEFEGRVVDDNDKPVPAGVEGELVVRCAGDDPRRGFFAGYLKNPEATDEAWRGGWFHTGDVVRQDADGMLYFVDRKKNIIRRSGENIAAAEIEAVLQTHPAVAQVAVLAVPDELREEEVLACIVPMPDAEAGAPLADELMGWCLDRLAYFKAPGWILFLDSLPTTGTQKVQKTQIFPGGEDPRQRAGILDLRGRKKRRG